jgi:hypothetical protein
MLTDFKRAFGLTDNPFQPTRTLPCTTAIKPFLLNGLAKLPLRVHDEECLNPLFVEDAGPFADHLRDFRDMLAVDGYSDAGAGTASNAFLIAGEQGTGKSTLAYKMAQWIGQCVAQPGWQTVEYPPVGRQALNVSEPLPFLIEQLDSQTTDGYARVIVDDVSRAELPGILKLYDAYTKTRVVMLILISSDLEVLRDQTDNSRWEVHRFETKPIAPDQAAAFVRARIDFYRDEGFTERLTANPLFPFSPVDIERNVVDRAGQGSGVVTLRMLSSLLNEAMRARLRELPNNYDLEQIPPSQLEPELIHIQQKYSELVNPDGGA